MKTKIVLNVKKLDRQKLKNLKAGSIIPDRWVCCTSTEDGQCCEWAIDVWNCRYIYC